MGDSVPIRENRFSRDGLLCQSGVPVGGKPAHLLMAPVISSDIDLTKESQYIESETVKQFQKNPNFLTTYFTSPHKIADKTVDVRQSILQCLEKREDERLCLQEIGGKLGYGYVVFGKLEREESFLSLTLKILESETGEIQSSRLVKMPQADPSIMPEILPVLGCQLMKPLLRFPDSQNGVAANSSGKSAKSVVPGMAVAKPAALNITTEAPIDGKGSDAAVSEEIFWSQWMMIGGGVGSVLALVSGILSNSESSDIAERRQDLIDELVEEGAVIRDVNGVFRFTSDEDVEKYNDSLKTLKRDGVDASDSAILYFTVSAVVFAASAALLVAQWKGDPIFGSDDVQPEVFPEDSKLNFRIRF